MPARKKSDDIDVEPVEDDAPRSEPIDSTHPESMEPGSTFASRAKARNKRIGADDASSKKK